MKKLNADDYLSCAFFTILACILSVLAYKVNCYDGLGGFALLLGFMSLICILLGLWSLSDFKTWK